MARSHSTRKACIPKAAAHKASILRPVRRIRVLFVVAPRGGAASSSPRPKPMQEDKLLNALKEGDKITGRITIRMRCRH